MPEIGHGSYGKVYVGKTDKGEPCAVKVEKADEPTPQLRYEARVLRFLDGCKGVPRMFGYWVSESKGNRHLAMELLGDTLEQRLRQHRLPMHVVMGSIAPTYIRILKEIHNKGFVHRDIKPQNMMTGPPSDPTSLYLIDYGLAKRFMHPHGGQHIAFREGKRLTGNLRYAAVNVHLGHESARRDDMEALGYVLIYFARGGMLPWMSAPGNRKKETPQEMNERVKTMKMATRVDDLCQGLPAAFAHYLRHVRALKFEQQPDYEFLASLFEVGLHDVMSTASMVGSVVSMGRASHGSRETRTTLKEDP